MLWQEQIVEILIHSSIDNSQPGTTLNSEQNANEMHFGPVMAQVNVSVSLFFRLSVRNKALLLRE